MIDFVGPPALAAGGEPSTWFTPGGLVETTAIKLARVHDNVHVKTNAFRNEQTQNFKHTHMKIKYKLSNTSDKSKKTTDMHVNNK